MSVFDGLASVLNSEFGAEVTVFAGTEAATTLRGIFREEPREGEAADGRPVVVTEPVLRLLATAPVLPKGTRIVPSGFVGRMFQVLRRLPPASPASDAHVVYFCEEIT